MRFDLKYLLAAGLGAAVLGAPLAVAAGEGDPIIGGERNPSPNPSLELNDETQIIADTSRGEYGTRQSNKGEGGGAIYGCRADRRPADDDEVACIRANNLSDGQAFSFETRGPIAGEIEVGDPAAEPFATNGRGKVENLNSDMVDSTDVGPIIARLFPGQSTPRPLAQSGSLSVHMDCGQDGDLTVSATTDESNAIIHAYGHGIGEGTDDFEAQDDTFSPGETFVTGFDQSHSGAIRYFDDDEAIAIDLSTDEQGGDGRTCVAFGMILGGPHAVNASVAPPPGG
ncbi:MAG TPA: hypothetical protein VGR12_04940 [Solirubrobacteraceae bacterium]|nr:hypothetical protein [Solirubrobacteraceae bacterium]